MVSRKAIAVAGLSAIALAASGCGGGSESEAEKFRAAFKKNFGEAPWYHHITGMEVADGRLKITTDLDSGSDWETAGGPHCGVALRFAFDHEVGDGIDVVIIIGSDGSELGGCG